MKKSLFSLFFAGLVALATVSCKKEPVEPDPHTEVETYYSVKFEVDGVRYKTEKVKEGEKIIVEISDPRKEGYTFDGWYEGNNLVDLTTYVVNDNVTFTAHFTENTIVPPDENALDVEQTKEEGKSYYLVLGWWEQFNDDGSIKGTSGLTVDSVRMIFTNIINYLKLVGATEEQINNISIRNYSSTTVAIMGENVNKDNDVDLLFGVGVNVFTTAKCVPQVDTNTSKFATNMGPESKSRYVAILKDASEVATSLYEWLKDPNNAVSKKALLEEVSEEELRSSLVKEEINLKVTVHGKTDVVTTLTDADSLVNMPEFAEKEGFDLIGLANSAEGEAFTTSFELKYNDLVSLAVNGEVNLYPVYQEKNVKQQVNIFVQANENGASELEKALLLNRVSNLFNEEAIVNSVASADDADLVICLASEVSGYTAHAQGAAVDVGAKHFAKPLKVLIKDSVKAASLAKVLEVYNLVKNEATELNLHITFWVKNYEWVTEERVNGLKSEIQAFLQTNLGLVGEETLEAKYNVTLTFEQPTQTKVGDLGQATNAYRDGKGTDLIIGCGANVGTTGNVKVVDKKVVSNFFLGVSDRQVALTSNNVLAELIYNNFFVVDR